MNVLNLEAFRATPLVRQPFEYLVLPEFVKPSALEAIHAGFPSVERPGSFPLSEVTYGRGFSELIEELNGPEVRAAFEEKFGIDLSARPTMITVRGFCSPKDGKIHTDALSKIITVLVYMNPKWESAGGRLRLLRSADDLEDAILEVPPHQGTLLAFRRSNNSFHGHKSFAGPRRVVQFNWITEQRIVDRELRRHRFSAWTKRVLPFLAPSKREAAANPPHRKAS